MAAQVSWRKWAVLEGFSKTASAVFQKMAGMASNSEGLAFIYTTILGVFHAVPGFCMLLRRPEREIAELLVPDLRSIMWPIAFGFCTTISNVVGPVAFMYHADLTARTLLILCSVVPASFLGMAFLGQKLDCVQWVGIVTFLAAAWAILDFPMWDGAGEVPLWVWITLLGTMSNAINELLVSKAALRLDVWVHNFWSGVSGMVWGIVGLLVLVLIAPRVAMDMNIDFFVAAVGTGVIVCFSSYFKFLAYKNDAWIALKKIVMNGTYLISATLIGLLAYQERFTIGKGMGIALFVLALAFSDTKVRGVVASRVLRATRT